MTRARDVATQGGLVLVSSTTIGSAVSSVTVNNAFSAAYDNYKIIISGGVGSTSNDLGLRLGATTTGYYASGYFVGSYTTGVVAGFNSSNGSLINVGLVRTNAIMVDVEIQSPNLVKRTMFSFRAAAAEAASTTFNGGGFLDNATQYTDLTFIPGSGTLTGGTIKVYGYK